MEDPPCCSTGKSEFKTIKKNGGTILLRGGHQFYAKRKHNSGLIVWACTNRKKCGGKLRTKNKQILEENAHDKECVPDFGKNEIAKSIEELKTELFKPDFPNVPQKYNALLGSFKDAGLNIVSKIPTFDGVKSTLYRQRNSEAGLSKIVNKNAREVKVPPRYQDFLLADYYNSSDNTRIIAFASKEARKTMAEVTAFYGDGTFRSCPLPFEELYTIHADTGSTLNQTNILPMIYAFMSDRKTQSYVILFNMIKLQLPGWNPTKFHVDFEKAAMKAIATVFPSITVKGCYFHFNKAVLKKGKVLNINKSEDPMALRLVELSSVLPLLPEEQIMNGWIYIVGRYGEGDTTGKKKFIKYMERQWLREEFPKVWCVFGETHRTTNALESWHHKLNQTVSKKKPNLMHLLHILKADSSQNTVRNIQRQLKTQKKRRPRKYILQDEFIQEVQLELTQGEIKVGHALEILRP